MQGARIRRQAANVVMRETREVETLFQRVPHVDKSSKDIVETQVRGGAIPMFALVAAPFRCHPMPFVLT